MTCLQCHSVLAVGARFCSECGADVVELTRRAHRRGSRLVEERRQLTVMFYDLVESTAMAADMDVEEFAGLIGRLHDVVGAAVARFHGSLGARAGDGAVVYFGYPDAREDATECAVLAGLAAVEAASELRGADGTALRVRVGIATGPVVVALGHSKLGNEALGATANLAARLQSAAEPGDVLVSNTTHQLVEGLFSFQALGPVAARGFAEAVNAWRVSASLPAEDRFGALHARRPSVLLGREPELSKLFELWRAAETGHGSIVLISGEAGIGKSCLATAFRRRLQGEQVSLRCFCSPRGQDSPLRPFIGLLERVAGFTRDDSVEIRTRKLRFALAPGTDAKDLETLGRLLGLPIGQTTDALGISPAQWNEVLVATLIRQLDSLAASRPVLILFEDAHWADPSSLALLRAVFAKPTRRRALLVVTARPEFDPPWDRAGFVTHIPLSPLDPNLSAQLVEQVAGERAIPPRLRAAILDRADGVPLFLEELTRTVLDLEDKLLDAEELPSNLQASLLARLDRLGSAKTLAQIGAVIGRDFSLDLAGALSGQDRQDLARDMQALVASGLVIENHAPPGFAYLFKHALVQETAYGTLLKSDRRRLHGELVKLLPQRFPDLISERPELLAHHATQGGLTEVAARWWLSAGLHALGRSALVEAARRFDRGLRLAEDLPVGADRTSLELTLELARGKALVAMHGYAYAEAGQAFVRARDQCRTLGEPPQTATALYGLWAHDFLRARISSAARRADELLQMGEVGENQLWSMMGLRLQGVTAFALGDFPEAVRCLQDALRLLNRSPISECAEFTVDDAQIVIRSYLAWTLAHMGQVEKAWALQHQALTEARSLGQPYCFAHALKGSVYVRLITGEPAGAEAEIDELATFTHEHGIAYYAAMGDILRARWLTLMGREDEAIPQFRTSIAAYRATRSRLYLPTFMMWKADAEARTGAVDQGLRTISRANQLAKHSHTRLDEAELLRTEAKLLRLAGFPHQSKSARNPAATRPQIAHDLMRQAVS